VRPTAFGGMKGRDVAQAVDSLLQEFENNGIWVSLDSQKCFDCMISMLLSFMGDFLPSSISVDVSLPQGDALSPITLIAVITGFTTKVLPQEPERHELATYTISNL
jgi:hypothetical protein